MAVKYINVSLLLLGVVFLSSCKQNKTTWARYDAKDAGFTVYMPVPVVKSEKKEVTAFGKATTYFYAWRPSSFAIDKFKLFAVSYEDIPSGYLSDSARIGRILDSSINIRKNDFTELKDIEAQVITFNGFPGRTFIYSEQKGNTTAIVKQFIAYNRKYDLTVVCKKDYPTNAEISAFFDSFQILR